VARRVEFAAFADAAESACHRVGGVVDDHRIAVAASGRVAMGGRQSGAGDVDSAVDHDPVVAGTGGDTVDIQCQRAARVQSQVAIDGQGADASAARGQGAAILHGDVAAQGAAAGQGGATGHGGGVAGAAIDHQGAGGDSGGSGIGVAVGEGQFTGPGLGQCTGSRDHAGQRRAVAEADVEDLRGSASQGDGAASQRQAVGLSHVEGQAFVQGYGVEVQCLAGQAAGEDDGLAAGGIGCGDGNGFTEADAVTEIDGRRVGGVGDVD